MLNFKSRKKLLTALLAAVFWICRLPAGLAAETPAAKSNAPLFGYEIVATYDHDSQAFTQGFCIAGGRLYEGTGLYGHSSLRRMNLAGGELEQRALPDYLFGEGVTVFKDRVIQLTWQSNTGLVWERENLQFIRSFFYATEGWGITHDDRFLIMSDGSATLTFLDPETYVPQKRVVVRAGGEPVNRLNELEYVKGKIWANIWKDNRIAIINPADGEVAGWLDLTRLAEQYAPSDADSVLNGIAYDQENDRLYITGKRWGKIFEIRLVEKKSP